MEYDADDCKHGEYSYMCSVAQCFHVFMAQLHIGSMWVVREVSADCVLYAPVVTVHSLHFCLNLGECLLEQVPLVDY